MTGGATAEYNGPRCGEICLIIMDPITTAILAALAKLAEPAIKDSYDGLKAIIKRKFGANGTCTGASDRNAHQRPDHRSRCKGSLNVGAPLEGRVACSLNPPFVIRVVFMELRRIRALRVDVDTRRKNPTQYGAGCDKRRYCPNRFQVSGNATIGIKLRLKRFLRADICLARNPSGKTSRHA